MDTLKSYSWVAGFLILAAGLGLFLVAPGQRMWSLILMLGGGLLVASGIAFNLTDLLSILKGRAVRYGANAVFYSVLVLLIVVAVNFLSARHRKRVDLTSSGANTLAPQTIRILGSLAKDVEMIAFYTDNGTQQRQRFEDLAGEYRYHTRRLKARVVNPLKSPGEARQYEIVQDGTVVVLSENGEARLTRVSEQELTNAILKATRERTSTVCFATGHGEASLADTRASGFQQAGDALLKESYKAEDLLLLQEPEVPERCDALIIPGATTALLETEVASLRRYLGGGGRLMVLKRDPKTETGLDDLLAGYGLKVNSDTVVDKLSRAIIGDEFVPVVTAYDSHPVTRALNDNQMASFFPVASSVEATEPIEEGITSRVIARTSDNAWGETGEVVSFQEGEDRAGPVGIVAVASGPVSWAEGEPGGAGSGGEETEGGGEGEPPGEGRVERRLVLFGDSDFASNAYLHLSGNTDLFLNAVGWLTEEEDLISIRPRDDSPQPVTLTASRANVLSAMTFLTPLVAVMGAVMVWFQRRRL
jgi:ABC-type uncharacterized transport system involved in gliding motility auxiliary subunit